MKKNNTAEKTTRNAQDIVRALKESTEKSLKDLVNEAIDNLINDEDDEEKEKDTEEPEVDDEESYEVEDVETEDDAESDDDAEVEAGEDDLDDDTEDEWSDMEEFKVGDNDYDFTGVDGETALKVYNKLGDDDQIFVKKDEDGNYEVKDEETGAEYVIELNADAVEDEEPVEDDTEFEVEIGSEEPEDDEVMFDLEMDADSDETEDDEEDSFEIEVDDEDEDKEELDEDKNFVVKDYQKDVMPGLNMSEPANSNATNDWDNGAPKGNSRPYGKRGNDKPFDQSVNECGDMTAPADLNEDGQGLNTKHSTKKSTNRLNKNAQNQRNVSEPETATVYALKEQAKRIYEKAKAIQEENKQYAKCIEQLKKSIYEAATLNVNMGQVIKLLVNETTTANEKKAILERFNGVKTIKEGKILYEAIHNELNNSKKGTIMLEQQISAKPSINETTIYRSNPSLDLMARMDNLYK